MKIHRARAAGTGRRATEGRRAAGRGSDGGALSAEQLGWFRNELAAASDQPTILSSSKNRRSRTSPSDTLDAGQVSTLLADHAGTPGLFLHHASHTHRNKRTISPAAPT